MVYGKWLYLVVVMSCWSFTIQVRPAMSGNISASVRANINTLVQTNSCSGCDLVGADLNRMKLSGANLEGANLADAKIFLADLTGANLKQANLQRTKFGGSDLADADLRGADLRGADLSGAYLEGAKFDGEFISANPFEKQGIDEIEKDIYVEDTVKPKVVPVKKEVTIGQRRDFQETPPVIEMRIAKSEKPMGIVGGQTPSPTEKRGPVQSPLPTSEWKVKEQKSDAVKKIHPIQDISFQKKEEKSNKEIPGAGGGSDGNLVVSVFKSKSEQPSATKASLSQQDNGKY